MRFSTMIAGASANCCKGRTPPPDVVRVRTAPTQTQTPQSSTDSLPEDRQQPATWGKVFGS